VKVDVTPTSTRWWLVILPCLVIAGFVTLRVFVDFVEPQREPPQWVTDIYADRWELYRVMGLTSVLFGTFAAARISAEIRRWLDGVSGRRTTGVLLTLAVLFAGFNYAYFARVLRQPGWVQTHDSFHYTLGAKYFPEAGYTDFYDCVLLTKAGSRIPAKTRMRHLEDYTFGSVGETRQKLRKDDKCKSRFSEERWDQLNADLQGLFRENDRPGFVPSGSLRDKGYNGTPLHAFVMGKLGQVARTLDIVTVARMTLVDVWGICAAGFFLCVGFGWRAGMLCSIYYFVAAADRFDMIGGSPSRYYWMCFLAFGVAALARRRWALAGASLTVSTALAAFPLFYWAGASVSFAADLLRHRIAAGRRFLVSSILAGAVSLALGASHSKGLTNFTAWFDDMHIHSVDSRPSDVPPGPMKATPGFGLGLRFAMMYSVREDDKRGRSARLLEYRRIRPAYNILSWAFMLFGLVVATRLRPAAACIIMGSLSFWALQGTVGYYFVCASVLPLLLVAGWRPGQQGCDIEAVVPEPNDSRDRCAPEISAALEAALWGVNAYALLALFRTHDRNTMLQFDLSVGLGLWMVAALIAFAWLGQPHRHLLAHIRGALRGLSAEEGSARQK